MRVLALLAVGATFFAAAPTAQAATGSAPSLTPVASSGVQHAAAKWPSCVKATRTKLNNSGWSDPKWLVEVANHCHSKIKYSIFRDHNSDWGYVTVPAGKVGRSRVGKYSFGHSASKPDGVKIYYKGTRYKKRF